MTVPPTDICTLHIPTIGSDESSTRISDAALSSTSQACLCNFGCDNRWVGGHCAIAVPKSATPTTVVLNATITALNESFIVLLLQNLRKFWNRDEHPAGKSSREQWRDHEVLVKKG